MRTNKIKPSGAWLIIIAASLRALDGVIRRSLYSLPPVVIVFWEHLVGTLILLPVFFKGLKQEKITKKELGIVGIISLLSGLLGTLWFTTALLMVNYISFSVVFLIQKLQPIFAILTAKILLKEKLSKQYLKYAGLALFSAYFVTFPNGIVNLHTGKRTVVAALYALGAAIAWGSSTAFSRFVLLKNEDKFITSLRFIFTTFLAFIAIGLMRIPLKTLLINYSQLLRFIFIACSTGMVALLIYYKGLKQTEVKIATILELTFPLLAIVIDMFLYKSFLSLTQIIAAAILLYSMVKVSRLANIK